MQDLVEMGNVEKRRNLLVGPNNGEAPAETQCRRVPADEGPDADTVEVRYGAQVEDDVAAPAPEMGLDRALEVLRRSSGDQRFARRDDEFPAGEAGR